MYVKYVFFQLEGSGNLLLSAEVPTACSSKETLIQELCFARLVRVCVLIQL